MHVIQTILGPVNWQLELVVRVITVFCPAQALWGVAVAGRHVEIVPVPSHSMLY